MTKRLFTFVAALALSISAIAGTVEISQEKLDSSDKISAVNDNLNYLYTGKLDIRPSHVIPKIGSRYDLGSSSYHWLNGYIDNITASSMTVSTLTATSASITTAIISSATISTAAITNLTATTLTATTGNITTLTATSITATTVAASTANLTSINGTFIGLGHNRVMNGEFLIDQRKVGTALTINSVTPAYGVDRWAGSGQGSEGVFTLQQLTTTPPTGFLNYLHAVVTTTDAVITSTQAYGITQPIEGTVVRDFKLGSGSAVTFTLSFSVRSSTTGTLGGSFQNSALDRSYPFSYTISTANTWEKKTVTVAGDTTGTWLTTTGVGMYLNFSLGAGSSKLGTSGSWAASQLAGPTGQVNLIGISTNTSIDFTGIQLEIGSIASAYEYRLPQIELMLCQRYYVKTFKQTVAPAQNTNDFTGVIHASAWVTTNRHHGGLFVFPVEMRVAPTITTYNPHGANAFWRDFGDANSTLTAASEHISTREAWIYINEAIGGADNFSIHAAADSEL